MKKKTARWMGAVLAAVACSAALLAGCQKKEELPDLSGMGTVVIAAREEGSGTRAEFENLIGTGENGTSVTADSTEEMIRTVREERNAIGYAAIGALTAEDGVKVLKVEGITPEQSTIEKKKYPLCRNYYLAYSGELSDVEQDFLTYIMGAGQKLVPDYGIPVRKVSSFLSDQSQGTIRINGSSSEAPLLKALAEDYKTYNSHAQIQIEVTDSTTGLNKAMDGSCDLAMSSRKLKDYEKELLQSQAIAIDGIAVIVNLENPVENLSVEQIRAIYDGKYETWGDLK